MKQYCLLIAVAALIPPFHALHADTLDPDPITISGSIIQMTNTNGETTSSPITIANVLSITGTTGVAEDLRYYFDADANSGQGAFVIAPKTGAPITPTATVLAFNGAAQAWNSNKGSYFACGGVVGLDYNLTRAGYSCIT